MLFFERWYSYHVFREAVTLGKREYDNKQARSRLIRTINTGELKCIYILFYKCLCTYTDLIYHIQPHVSTIIFGRTVVVSVLLSLIISSSRSWYCVGAQHGTNSNLRFGLYIIFCKQHKITNFFNEWERTKYFSKIINMIRENPDFWEITSKQQSYASK